MKKALFFLSVFAITASSVAQMSSSVIFKNRNIPTSQPNPTLPGYIPGGNGNGTYNVPIYADDYNSVSGGAIGAGTLPGGVTVGLYYKNNLLATTILGTTANSAPYFVTPATQEVLIKDASGAVPPPGSTPVLTIRAWTTASGSFAGAQITPGGLWGEWTVTSPPLSGIPPGGGAEIDPSALTGWGFEDGSGVSMGEPYYPQAVIIDPKYFLTGVFATPASVRVTGLTIIPRGYPFMLTNLTLFADGARLSSHSGSVRELTVNTPPLAVGSHFFTAVADGYLMSGGQNQSRSYTSGPVYIRVVTPVDISITPPQIANGEFQFNYAANVGLKYVIKTSADLFDWQPIATNTPTANPALFTQPFDPAAARYYRIERLPNP